MKIKMLTESEVIFAAQTVFSNRQAASFYRISEMTWKRYSSMYFEPTTGKTYYDYLRVKKTLERRKAAYNSGTAKKANINNILNGLVPTYSKVKLHDRLIDEGYFDNCCSMCGFNEKNILTRKVPLVLDCVDGDETNFTRNNLQFLCYNCCQLVGQYKFKITKLK
jgi:hypothetical protein